MSATQSTDTQGRMWLNQRWELDPGTLRLSIDPTGPINYDALGDLVAAIETFVAAQRPSGGDGS